MKRYFCYQRELGREVIRARPVLILLLNRNLAMITLFYLFGFISFGTPALFKV